MNEPTKKKLVYGEDTQDPDATAAVREKVHDVSDYQGGTELTVTKATGKYQPNNGEYGPDMAQGNPEGSRYGDRDFDSSDNASGGNYPNSGYGDFIV